jgi:hypothetical protein
MIRRKRMLNLRYCCYLDYSKTTDSILFVQENLVGVAHERRLFYKDEDLNLVSIFCGKFHMRGPSLGLICGEVF